MGLARAVLVDRVAGQGFPFEHIHPHSRIEDRRSKEEVGRIFVHSKCSGEQTVQKRIGSMQCVDGSRVLERVLVVEGRERNEFDRLNLMVSIAHPPCTDLPILI
jgi:hypothetical protein